MALSGLDIFKHLPKTNCKDCGVPTCLAFAMKVAAGQATLADCPHVSEAGKAALSEAGAPPQQLVKIGAGDKALEIGQETVLYRHDERFHRPAIVAVRVSTAMDAAALQERCKKAAAVNFERMGSKLAVGMVLVDDEAGDAAKFAEAAKTAAASSGKALALRSASADSLKAAGTALKADKPLLWAADGAAEAAIPVAKELALPLCLEAPGFDDVLPLAEKARAAGLKELVLSPGALPASGTLEFLTQTRRAAIQKKFRPVGYPVAALARGEDAMQAVIDACWFVLKYAGIVVVDTVEPQHLLGILATRQDIYTNPQVPVKVEPGLHPVGDPGKDAPVLVTTNFALSYYSVESEVEASRVPAFILSVDTEGTSVLTAWAADKFNAATITAALKGSGVEARLGHKKLVLPGLVAVLRAGVEDESGWKAVVGPKEASGIGSFLKNQWKP
ncbi:MAG TPA: acetyl-CoA decarbonylase/synthase complex subunit gamma [Planctomycetes bacterium]|nr:acetyl-CoA decarbonylase/synthase complex subunit gamma [Planctomycetota bacterium]